MRSYLSCILIISLLWACSSEPSAVHGDSQADEALHSGADALHHAAQEGMPQRVEELLDAGAEIDSRDQFERTPLHLAAAAGHADVVALLLERGADLAAVSWYDLTALHWAALMGRDGCARILIHSGATIRARTLHGMTALHLASTPPVVRILVDAGASVGAADRAGLTPLHLAYSEGVAQALIDAGANVAARARDGRGPLTMAAASNEELGLVVIYPDRDHVRLRGENSDLGVLLRSVTPQAIEQLRIEVEAVGVEAKLEPARLQRLNPAEIVPLRLTVARNLGTQPQGATVTLRLVDAQARELATVTLAVDARAQETPEDRGLVPVSTVTVRREPGIEQYIAYLGAPMLLLLIWGVSRLRRRARRQRDADAR